jgi:hypothetical protein
MPVIQGIDTEYKPWGGLAGFTTGERRAEMDAANMQALQESQLSNALKEVEARRAQSDFSNPEMEQWRQQGIMGKNMSDYSKGQLDYKTLDSNIKTKLAENMSKASAAEIEATINGLDQFISVASSDNPLAMHQAMASLPPQYQKIVQQLGPQQSVAYAKQLSDTIKQARMDSPTHRAKMAEIDRTAENQEITRQGDRESQETIQRMSNANQVKLEQMRIDAGKYANKNADRLVLFQKLHPEIQLAKINAALKTGTDPITGEKLDKQGNDYWTMYGQSLGASAELKVPQQEGKIAVPKVAGMPAVSTPKAIVPGQTTNNKPKASDF